MIWNAKSRIVKLLKKIWGVLEKNVSAWPILPQYLYCLDTNHLVHPFIDLTQQSRFFVNSPFGYEIEAADWVTDHKIMHEGEKRTNDIKVQVGGLTEFPLIQRLLGAAVGGRGRSSYKHCTVHTDLHCVWTWSTVMPGKPTSGTSSEGDILYTTVNGTETNPTIPILQTLALKCALVNSSLIHVQSYGVRLKIHNYFHLAFPLEFKRRAVVHFQIQGCRDWEPKQM